MRLREIAHSRTGDKGDTSNISVIAFDAAHFEHLREHVTAERVKALFAGTVRGEVTRFELPLIGALNFVLAEALGGGVTRSLAIDGHGKSLSSALLDLEIPAPNDLGATSGVAAAGIAPADLVPGEEGVFTAREFVFESGERLECLRIGYVTHGMLSPARDNAVLVLPGTANTRHSADGYIGPGRALDTDRLFVIATDAIGAGTSSSPGDGLGGAFPRYSVRDMMNAAHRLVTEHLGLARLKAVVGASMGAFQALEWSIHRPDAAERAVLLVPAVRAGSIFKNAVRAMIDVIRLDGAWCQGAYAEQPLAGLRAAGRLYFPWTVSDAYLEALDPERLQQELQTTIDRTAAWDAWTLIRRYQASASHDVGAPFSGDIASALARVAAPVLVMPTTTDRLLGIESARQIARQVRQATYVEIPSERGHLGWRAVTGAPETTLITQQITRFLSEGEDPS